MSPLDEAGHKIIGPKVKSEKMIPLMLKYPTYEHVYKDLYKLVNPHPVVMGTDRKVLCTLPAVEEIPIGYLIGIVQKHLREEKDEKSRT